VALVLAALREREVAFVGDGQTLLDAVDDEGTIFFMKFFFLS